MVLTYKVGDKVRLLRPIDDFTEGKAYSIMDIVDKVIVLANDYGQRTNFTEIGYAKEWLQKLPTVKRNLPEWF